MARTIYEEHFSGGGVTSSGVYEEDGQIICVEKMPGWAIEKILDHNRAIQNMGKRSTDRGRLAGSIPITLWTLWRNEWMKGPKLWGVPWKKFKARKLNSADYSKLRSEKL